MKVYEYVIVYFDGKNTTTTTCRSALILEYIEKIMKQYDNEISIYIQPKAEEVAKVEKQKYYKSKYVLASKKYKQGKIDKKEFEDDIKKLKELKKECITRLEYEEKYKNYQNKKNTNNIPPYNVSD